MTPDQSRARRELARRRRQRRRAIGFAAFVAVVVVAGAIALLVSKSSGHPGAVATTSSTKRQPPKAVIGPKLSAIGLPLARPALALKGIGLEQQDAVHIAFHHPPRAGVLFNLTTGQVLWQRNPFARLRIASLTKMMTALLSVKSAAPDGRVLVTKAEMLPATCWASAIAASLPEGSSRP